MMRGIQKIALILFLLIVPIALQANVLLKTIDKTEILQLLYEEKFDLLEKKLQEITYHFTQKKPSESYLRYTYTTFENSDPALQALLDHWIQLHPNSESANLAQAFYHKKLAWLSRGNRYANKTSPLQFMGMHQHLEIAQASLERVLNINPNNLIAYDMLITIAMLNGEKQKKRLLYDQAITRHPYSYILRDSYLFSLQPKWGGSLMEIKHFANETRQYYPQNPELQKLEGFLEYAKAAATKSNDEKIPLLNDAINKSHNPNYLFARSEIYAKGKLELAINDITTALEEFPQQSALLAKRGEYYYYIREYQKALQDLNLTLALDHMNPRAHKYRGQIFLKFGPLDKAEEDLLAALIYSPRDYNLYIALGTLYSKNHHYNKAVDAYKTALNLGSSDDPKLYRLLPVLYVLADAQRQIGDCEFITTIHTYSDICSERNVCNKNTLDGVKNGMETILKSAQDALDQGKCQNKSLNSL